MWCHTCLDISSCFIPHLSGYFLSFFFGIIPYVIHTYIYICSFLLLGQLTLFSSSILFSLLLFSPHLEINSITSISLYFSLSPRDVTKTIANSKRSGYERSLFLQKDIRLNYEIIFSFFKDLFAFSKKIFVSSGWYCILSSSHICSSFFYGSISLEI
jgi:hypothetical protein